ncbi:MAG TPA: D-2-hydroxyacid dehydrogenase [Clostridia bacterium]|nr:D-2-hydroxyacid dehydrogenase [Clostridia bacterium]
MEIVILDGCAVNPGDLSWNDIEKFGNLTVYDNTPEELIVPRSEDAEAIFVNRVVLNREIIGSLKKLRFVGALGTGYNMIDLDACREKGVTVCNIPDYSTMSVAQHVFALILHFTNSPASFHSAVLDGKWPGRREMNFLDYHFIELWGKTLGIIGLGSIGKQVAKIASAFGMNVIATSRTQTEGIRDGINMASLEAVLGQSDILSLNCPLTDQTRGMINENTIKQMKDGVILINTSRGPVIDEHALADALNKGKVRGAGLDVLTSEPPEKSCPLLTAKNCLLTPHIAWATKEARTRLLKIVAENLEGYLNGKPVNRIV